jgi:hypothetical protein
MQREQKTTSVKRFELKDDKVILYFNEMESKKDYCVAVEVQQTFEVNDAKDANVKIYDYYQPEYVQSVAYNFPLGIGQGMSIKHYHIYSVRLFPNILISA